jgi:tetratricopeptide (TPR) repeat protein
MVLEKRFLQTACLLGKMYGLRQWIICFLLFVTVMCGCCSDTIPAFSEGLTSPDTNASSLPNTSIAAYVDAAIQDKSQCHFSKGIHRLEQALSILAQDPSKKLDPSWMVIYTLLIDFYSETSQPDLLRQTEKRALAWLQSLPMDWNPSLMASSKSDLRPMHVLLAQSSVAYRQDKPYEQIMAPIIKAKTLATSDLDQKAVLASEASLATRYGDEVVATNAFQQLLKLDSLSPYDKAKVYVSWGQFNYDLGKLSVAKAALQQAFSYQKDLKPGMYLAFMQADYLLHCIAKIPTQADYVKELSDTPLAPQQEKFKVKRWHDKTQVIRVLIPNGDSIPGWKPVYATWIPWALNS